MSQEDLSAALHVHTNSVIRWEGGTAAPDGEHLLAMCKLFNRDPEYLMEKVGERDA